MKSTEKITESLLRDVKSFLGEESLKIFEKYYLEYGEVNPWIKKSKFNTHIVDFAEGLTIKRFLREHPECKYWTCCDFDQLWPKIITVLVLDNLGIVHATKHKGILYWLVRFREWLHYKRLC